MRMRLFRTLPTISPRETAERLSRGELQLVDVREAAEVAAGGVPAARHIPLRRIQGEMERLDRARPMAFVCQSGGRSTAATRAALAPRASTPRTCPTACPRGRGKDYR